MKNLNLRTATGLLLFGTVSCLMLLEPVDAQADEVDLRLLGGIGRVRTNYEVNNMDKQGGHAVMQILHHIPQGRFPHSWGLELGRHRIFSSSEGNLEYDMIGIMVESNPYKRLLLNLGTAGYLGRGGISDANAVGLRASVGSFIPISKRLRLMGFIRQDIILDERQTSLLGVEGGLQIRVWP